MDDHFSWKSARTRVLLTGFGAFPGAPANPTERIVQRIARRHARHRLRRDIDLHTAILPVVYAGTGRRIRRLLDEHRPDIVIHLGLAARRRELSVETRARNRLSIVHPDAEGRLSGSHAVLPGRPAQRRSRWPAARLVNVMRRTGAPSRASIDAGDYLCNQALFLSLEMHDGPCGFVHVPRLRNMRAPLRNSAGDRRRLLPRLEDAERAILAAIDMLVREYRHTRRGGAGQEPRR